MSLAPTRTAIPESILQDLNGHHTVTPAEIEYLRENGYVKIKNALTPETIRFFGEVVTDQVKRLNTLDLPMEQRSTYQKAFLQVMNIWTKNDTVKAFSFAPKLARLAAELLEVSGVRMYHDQALYKEPGGGITPWHADQYYWPLSSDRTITAWIPLQETRPEMGPLAFARKTHRMTFGRDIEISDDSEQLIQKTLKEARADIEETPFDLGEVSFHLGWTFHRAGANTSADPRRVMTIIYMDENIRAASPKNKNQENDLRDWCHNTSTGQVVDGPLNPVLWSQKS